MVEVRNHEVQHRWHRRAGHRQLDGRLRQHERTALGVAHGCGARGRRQLHDLAVARESDERVHRRVQARQRAHAARCAGQPHVHATLGAVQRGFGQPIALPGRKHTVHPTDGDRLPGHLRHGFDLGVLAVETGLLLTRVAARGREVVHRLQHAVGQAMEGRGQRVHLMAADLKRRRHVAAAGAVRLGAAQAETGGTVGQRRAQQAVHLAQVVVAGHFAARGALAHHVQAQRVVRHQGHEVQAVRHAVQGARVLAETLPAPAHAFGQHRFGNLFHALHQVDQLRLLARAHGCEADAAVAHHQRRHAVVDAGREGLVPAGLAVVMGVDVDEARQQVGACGVDAALCRAGDAAHFGDAAVADGHIGRVGCGAGAVDDGGAADQQLMHGDGPSADGLCEPV